MLKTIWRIMMSNREQVIREIIDRFGNGNNSINYESTAFRDRLVKEIANELNRIDNKK
jgi:hypothetical protein